MLSIPKKQYRLSNQDGIFLVSNNQTIPSCKIIITKKWQSNLPLNLFLLGSTEY